MSSRPDAILAAVGSAAHRFLTLASPWEASAQEVLGRLGAAAGASRAYLFENHRSADGRLRTRQRHQWTVPAAPSQAGSRTAEDFAWDDVGLRRWAACLAAGQPFHSRTRDLPEEEQAGPVAEGILSIALVPVFVEGSWWGFVGFDDCAAERSWTTPELDALRAAAGMFAAVIARQRAAEHLHDREAQYRGIFDATSDGMLVTDDVGTILQVNPAMCRMHGYADEAELLGRSARVIIDPAFHHLHLDFLAAIAAGDEYRTEAVDVRRDGSTFPVEVRGSVFEHEGRRRVLGVVRDVSERVQQRRLLEQRVSALSRIAAALAAGSSLQSKLRILAEGIVEASAGTACSVSLLRDDGQDLVTVETCGLPDGYPQAHRAVWDAGTREQTVEALRRQEPVVMTTFVDVLRHDPRYAPLARVLGEVTRGLLVVIPIIAGATPLGVVHVYYPAADPVHGDELAFLKAIADQGAVAVEHARLLEEAARSTLLEERQRLSRELHDSVSQAVYGIALGARTARALLDRDPARVAEPLDYVLDLAEAGLAEMRALLFELRPESLQREGLVAALDKQAQSMRARHGLAMELDLGSEPDLPLATKEGLYRIGREALHNVVKHARATLVQVRLHATEREVWLEVADDGAGFDVDGEFPGHLGLHTMRERAEELGAALQVTSAPATGTRVRVRVPRG